MSDPAEDLEDKLQKDLANDHTDVVINVDKPISPTVDLKNTFDVGKDQDTVTINIKI